MTETPGDAPAKRIPVDSLANRLMLARAHAGHISIREAADKCGFGRGAWTNWEKGTMPVDLDYVIEVISEKLGVDPVWLADGGALSEPETSRRARWSTVRPTHARRPKDRIAGDGEQTTPAKPTLTARPADPAERPRVERPRDNRPSGRPGRSAPSPTTRRPARV